MIDVTGQKVCKLNWSRSNAIEWSAFDPLLKDLYQNERTNIPIKIMIKVLFLQSMFNMVDEQAETLIRDRISFMNFLDYPDQYPDARTIWLFRERLSKTGKDRIIWNELQRQPELKGIRVKKGSAQDATFITSDPGHVKHDELRSEYKKGNLRESSVVEIWGTL